jgi:hypothetical protein
MHTMNMPGFTAEDSLYKTSRQYRTGRHAINLPTPMIGTIRLAAIDESGEVIVIVEEWPPDPWTPPSWGGAGGTPVPQAGNGGGGGGGGGGGAGPKPKPKPKPTPEERARAREIAKCEARCHGGHTGDVMKCAFDPDPDRCKSIADNVFSRCKTRCQEEPYHNAPL